jgi:hypothetical protein
MKKKKGMIGLLALLLTMVSLQVYADGVNGIRVTTSEKNSAGKEITYDFLFTSQPVVSYQDNYQDGKLVANEVSITSKDVKSKYGVDEIILNRSKMKSITFVEVSATGIKDLLRETDVVVKMEGQGLQMSGLKPGQTVTLYTPDGKKVGSVKATADGTANVLIPGSEAGALYIVKTGKLSFKFRTK